MENDPHNDKMIWASVAACLGVLLPICVIFVLYVFRRKFQKCKRHSDEVICDEEELTLLFEYQHDGTELKKEVSHIDIFDEWQKKDIDFVPTKASKEVENKTKHQNLVIVTGDSGSGKSAIIHHIALKYREQGWDVIPVMEVNEILKICPTVRNKSLFVLSDPIGKESFDEILYSSWQKYEEMLISTLKKCKLLVTCEKKCSL